MSPPAGDGVIYTSQPITTIISRGWNLLRLTFKDSVLLALIPTVCFTLAIMLFTFPASWTFLTPSGEAAMARDLVALALSVPVWLLFFVLWGFSNCALIRLYYSAMVLDAPLSVKDCWRFVWGIKWPIMLLMLVFTLMLAVFVALDFLILLVGGLMSMAAFGALGSFAGIAQNWLLTLMMIFFLLLWGFAVLTVTIGLMTVEGFFFVFPFIALSTAPQGPDRPSLPSLVGQAYRLLFSSLPRLVVFAIALFVFSSVLSTVLNAPIIVWASAEMLRQGVTQQHHLPMHVNLAINIWGSLIHLVLSPFYTAAITLFWYDCRVRKEGLDLRLWFNQMIQRRGKRPEDFMAPSGL